MTILNSLDDAAASNLSSETVTATAALASEGSGSGGGGGTTNGDLYGDQYIVVRDMDPLDGGGNGEPVLDANGQMILIGSDGRLIYFVQNADGDYEIPAEDLPFAQTVELERANVVRSPDSVLQKSLEEALAKIDAATSITTDLAGRIVCDGATIDSPLENLALYKYLMTAGGDTSWTEATAHWSETFQTLLAGGWSPASLAGAAFAKESPVSLDAVLYENTMIGVNTVSQVNGENQVSYYNFNDGTNEAFNYDRAAHYQDVWIQWYADTDGNPANLELVQDTLMHAVFGDQNFTDQYQGASAANAGVNDFAQAVEDARAVINFVHSHYGAVQIPIPPPSASQSDILFRNDSTGDTGLYRLNDDGSFHWISQGGSSTEYSIVGTGDFIGTGHPDVLFHNNATGDVGFNSVDLSGSVQGWVSIGGSATAYDAVGVGDFNADGVSDVLFRDASTGDTGFYRLNADGSLNGWQGIGGSSTAYTVAGVGDFNGDGVSDVLFQNTATGDTGYYKLNSDGSLNSWQGIAAASTDYALAGVGDFNGDGVSDVLFRNNATGDMGYYEMNAGGTLEAWRGIGVSSTAYWVEAIGDYNADGVSDVLFRDNSTGDTGFYQFGADGTVQGWRAIGPTSTAYSIIG